MDRDGVVGRNGAVVAILVVQHRMQTSRSVGFDNEHTMVYTIYRKAEVVV